MVLIESIGIPDLHFTARCMNYNWYVTNKLWTWTLYACMYQYVCRS